MNSAPLFAGLALAALAAAAHAENPRVLYVGDSHSAQYFGHALDADLRSTGDLVATFAVAGSKPSSWTSDAKLCFGSFFNVDDRLPACAAQTPCVKTPRFAELVAEYKPDAVVIALGSNGTAGVADLLKLLRAAPSRPNCFWVGPPHMRRVKAAQLDALYANLARAGITDSADPSVSCRLIDSRQFSYLRYPPTGGDGIHYNSGALIPLDKRWGHDVYNAIAGSLTTR